MSQREDHVERRIPFTVLDARQVPAAHPDAAREFLLLDARRFAMFADATPELHMGRIALVRNLTAHPHSLGPRTRPSENHVSRRTHA